MKKIRPLYVILAICIAVSCAKETVSSVTEESVTEEEDASTSGNAVAGQAIVRFSDEMVALIEDDLDAGKIATRSAGLNQALDELGITKIERLFPDAGEFEERTRREGLHRFYIVEYSDTVAVTRATAFLSDIEGIEYAGGNQRIKMDAYFDDPRYSEQWQYGSSVGINVSDVWQYYTAGSSDVVVAVVDEGIQQDHPDLQWNLYSDNYNFCSGSSTIVAGSHGTHVAGTIAAVNNNGLGVCGVAGGNYSTGQRGIQLMSCQVFEDESSGNTSRAIKWAADHGAVICNNSWGYDYDTNGDGVLTGSELTRALEGTASADAAAAFEYFIAYAGCDNSGEQLEDSPMKGGVIVFSAGNEGIANGAPANYEKVIAVGATTRNGTKATYTNYGSFVDICAPGSNILSTNYLSGYTTKSGTSMSCPHVTGVAALIASYFGGPGFTNEMLVEKLLGGANTSIISSSDQIGGMVDALGSFLYGEDSKPAKVTDLNAEVSGNAVSLDWTTPGESGDNMLYGFVVQYGTDSQKVAEAEPSSSSVDGVSRISISANYSVGDKVSCDISELSFETQYYFKVTAVSYFNVYGEDADVLAVMTGVNNPPVYSTDYVPVSLKASQTVTLAVTISDPDNHSFTVSYSSGSAADTYTRTNQNAISVTISGAGADAGTYTGVITATDSYGASSTYEIVYTILENNPPVNYSPIGNYLISAGEQVSLTMSDYFSDPDEDSLTYSTEYSVGNIISFSALNGVLSGSGANNGMLTVTVTASDSKATASSSFKVIVRDESVKCQVYPVPVESTLYVGTGESTESTKVTVTSQTGKVVFEQTLQVSAFEPAEIDMSSCASGTYSVKVKSASVDHTQTIVKK